MGGHIFTIDGRLYDKQYDDRIIGVTLDDFKNIATTIVVAAGHDKTEAILGALRTGAVSVLVTDDRTASSMLTVNKMLALENADDK
jgi:DNA-binding transcriptional regulator LsrR (DeoR family)